MELMKTFCCCHKSENSGGKKQQLRTKYLEERKWGVHLLAMNFQCGMGMKCFSRILRDSPTGRILIDIRKN